MISSFIAWYLKKRIHNIELFLKHPIEVQRELLQNLLHTAKDTELGTLYDFASIQTYEQFANRVPLVTYEEFEPLIERTRLGERNVIWPTKIKWFAKSSGTTNAKSKFIPVSDESLEDCHLKAGKDMLSLYLNNNPESNLTDGKNLRLGGSQKIHESGETYFGDLSAILINNTPFWANFKSCPSQKVSLMSDWNEKLDAITQEVINEDIVSIAGVPSWMMVLLNHILKHTEKETLSELWPNLEVFFHGGINFLPYQESYKQLINKDIKYYEVYNASEGFFGLQDTNDVKEMLLMLDYGIFYEFIPMETFYDEHPAVIPLDQVEVGKNYAIVITTNGGLWRYIIGDTIKFTSVSPYRIVISGRTKHYINSFGEELIVDNAQEGLKAACEATDALISEFTAGPVYMQGKESGAHEWIIEFKKPPADFELFKKVLDQRLQEVNSDYEAKRFNNMTLNPPVVHIARENLFFDWMKERGKLGGQNKVPRLSNNREFLNPLLELMRGE